MSTAATATRDDRRVPPLGGFNLTFLGMELRRMLRNRRTLVFALLLPPVFFLLFGTQGDYKTNYAYPHGNITGYVMVSMAVYDTMAPPPAVGPWCPSNAPWAGAGSCG